MIIEGIIRGSTLNELLSFDDYFSSQELHKAYGKLSKGFSFEEVLSKALHELLINRDSYMDFSIEKAGESYEIKVLKYIK